MVFLFSVALASCSVKEDRGDCPAYVTVNVDRFINRDLPNGTVVFDDPFAHHSEEINFYPYSGIGYEWPVDRHLARVTVLSGYDREKIGESEVRVPYGQMAGMVWAYTETFSAESDLYVVDAWPHKQYCLVRFMFDNGYKAPEPYPWRFRIKAECNGFDLYTLEPLVGEYCCTVWPNAQGQFSCIIPRQLGNNLIMEIFVPNEDSETEGRVEYVIDLGKRFENLGYDWSVPDLGDVSLKVGFASGEVDVSVDGWINDNTYQGKVI